MTRTHLPDSPDRDSFKSDNAEINRTQEDSLAEDVEMNSGSTSTAKRTNRHEPIPRKEKNVNRKYLINFIDAFRTPQFQNGFKMTKDDINRFCQHIQEVGGSASAPEPFRELYALSAEKMTRHNEKVDKDREEKQKKKKNPSEDDSAELKKVRIQSIVEVLATQQVRQILRASLSVHVYAESDPRIYELFIRIFKDENASPKYLVGTIYLPMILQTNRSKKRLYSLDARKKIEALLYFHCIEYHLSHKLKFNPNTGNRIGFLLQTLMKAWKRFVDNAEVERIGTLSNFLTPYMIYNEVTGLFEPLKSRNMGFSPIAMETKINGLKASDDIGNVSTAAWNRTNDVDNAFRFMVGMFFNHLHTMLDHSYLSLHWKRFRHHEMERNATVHATYQREGVTISVQ